MVKQASNAPAVKPITDPIVGHRAPEVAPAEVQPTLDSLSPEAKGVVEAAVAKYAAAMNKRVDMTPLSKANAIRKYTDKMIKGVPGMLDIAA